MRRIDLEGDIPSTRSFTGTDVQVALDSRELALVFDASRWRYDIPQWRWCRTGPGGEELGFARPDFDDSGWDVCPHLHPLYHASYADCAWFRHELRLPIEQAGQPISIVLGGMDDQDWSSYRVFLNGTELERWQASGPRREPSMLVPAPESEQYAALNFGGRNLLALEAAGLARPVPTDQRPESEHFLFQDWLLDQFLCAGAPYSIAAEFKVSEVRSPAGEPLEWLEFDLESSDGPAVAVSLSYRLNGPGRLRKSATVRNAGDVPLRLLELVLEDWRGDLGAGRGGRGQPVLTERLFVGVEHPAGVNRGERGRITVEQLPGRVLAPGETFQSESAVVGAAQPGESVEAAFRDYATGLRPRRAERVFVYSALGWYDFTNPADPLPELTEGLVEENLALLEQLREQAVAFDIYMLDDWWEPTDLSRFRERTFPAGGPALAERIRRAGMQPGLWSATTRALWTCDQASGIEASIAGGTGISPARPPQEESGQWSWDEEFASVFTREKRFCLAAEPYRSIFKQAIEQHTRELGLGCLKLDCATLHCTSAEHDHLPGKYSVEPIVNTIIETLTAAQTARPDLLTVLYWTFRSPWWLKHADTIFDKGIKMELASPATTPTPIFRQSINLHLDQAVRQASLLPLPQQDSLGLWWGTVALTNRFGKEEWRDAFLLDVARGSTLVQCWGDIGLLDRRDLGFLTDVMDWLRSHVGSFSTTREVGGDPRRADPYGYAQRTEEGAVVTLSNPSFETRSVPVDLAGLGLRLRELAAAELYPFPGLTAPDVLGDEAFEVELAPFEVRVLEFVRPELAAVLPPQRRPGIGRSHKLDLSVLAGGPVVENVGVRLLVGSLVLPQIRRDDRLAIVVRFQHDGVWRHDPEPRVLARLSARLKGIEVYSQVAPAVRTRTGLGSPWLMYSIPAGPAWTGEALDLRLHVDLPDGISLVLDGYIFDSWWLRHERRFSSPAALHAAALDSLVGSTP